MRKLFLLFLFHAFFSHQLNGEYILFFFPLTVFPSCEIILKRFSSQVSLKVSNTILEEE
jgi:hypothetical protein